MATTTVTVTEIAIETAARVHPNKVATDLKVRVVKGGTAVTDPNKGARVAEVHARFQRSLCH